MGIYQTDKIAIPTGLDEIGLQLGMQRIPGEDLAIYRKRLYLESRDRSGSTEQDFVRTTSRRAGLFDRPILEITLKEVDGLALAPDPYVEVTSTRLRLYSDHAEGTLEFELDIESRGGAYFVKDVVAELAISDFFDLTILDTEADYLRSHNLRFSNSTKLVVAEALFGSKENKLEHTKVRDFWATQPELFEVEVASKDLIAKEGDWYLDRENGVLFLYRTAQGFVSYTYQAFPFQLVWQPVRAYPLNDGDVRYLHYDKLLSDDGTDQWTVLNPVGALVSNRILTVHPLGWGR